MDGDLFRTIFDQAETLLLVTDTAGLLRAVNRSAARLLGYRADDLIGRRHITELHVGAELTARASQLSAERGRSVSAGLEVLVGGEGTWDCRYVCSDGRMVPVKVAASALRADAGSLLGYLFVATDSTADRTREARLQQLADIVEHAQDAIFSWSLEGLVMSWNRGAEAIFGYSADEIVGRSADGLIPPERVAELDTLYRRSLSGRAFVPHETERVAKDGRRVAVSLALSPIRAGDGTIMGMSAVARDISERRRSESQTREQTRVAAFESEVGLALSADRPLSVLLEECTEGAVRHLGVSAAGIWLRDLASGALALEAGAGLAPGAGGAHALAALAKVAARREPLVTEDPGELADWTGHTNLGGFAGFPLIADGRLQGLLAVGARQACSPLLVNGLASVARAVAQTIGRHRAQASLRDSEATTRAIVETAASGILTVDEHGTIESINPAGCRLFGYTAPELLGRNLSVLVPAPHAAHHAAYIERYLATGESEVLRGGRETCARRCDGQLLDIDLSVGEFTRGGQRHFVGMVRDITDRKTVEAQLKQSLQRFDLATRAAGLGVWDWDVPRNQLVWDDRMLELYGLTRDQFWGLWESWSACLHPDDLDRCEAEVQQALAGEADYDTEYRIVQPDGSVRHVKAFGQVIRDDDDGSPLRFIGVNYDISETKTIEESLRHAKQAAEAANHAKSVFLASMSHEIRTPMNAILGFSQLARHDTSVAAIQEKLTLVTRAGEHLLALINDILEVSKIEAGRITLEPSAFDLHALCEDLAVMFRLRAAQKGLSLGVACADSVPHYIVGDAGKLRQVLTNLMGNAVKFTQQGGVVLRVSANPLDGRRQLLRCEVEDTGPGLSEEDQVRVFQPFEQAGTAREQGGTGLGLTISRQYVRLMGGELGVVSRPGVGATFGFQVPVDQADAGAVAAPRGSARVLGLLPTQAPVRVLNVDDNELNRLLVRQLLVPLGFRVQDACNGLEALAAWREWQPHAILMDISMPVLDGREAIRAIRETGGEQPFIAAVTAAGFEEQRDELLAAGADAYLRKPFGEQELLELLAAPLGLEFIYEQEPVAPPLAAAGATPELDLSRLPAALLDQLALATANGELGRLHELLAQVAELDAAAAGHLGRLIDEIDYEALSAALAEAGAPSLV